MQHVERILCLHFALLTTLAGLLMSTGAYANDLWIVALFSAFGSYLFVDRLRWIRLPMPVAYLLMAAAAIYCMGDFIRQGGGELAKNGLQLTAVARLLVFVQAALLFQRKSRRVFEQIGMFCLLEIVVAAVLNDALMFGLLLIPISVIALSSLVLLQIWDPGRERDRSNKIISTRSGSWSGDPRSMARNTPRMAAGVLGPAVILFAAVFFYTLPRTPSNAGTPLASGPLTTGFSESLEINQLGRLLQNKTIVLRVHLTDMLTQEKYRVAGSLFLRGQTLEHYEFERGSSFWRASPSSAVQRGHHLPPEYVAGVDEPGEYDRVAVKIVAEPIESDTAFAVAPYFALSPNEEKSTNVKLSHTIGDWLLKIPEDANGGGRSEYAYGTHAFQRGRQTRWFRPLGPGESAYRASRYRRMRQSSWSHSIERSPPLTGLTDAQRESLTRLPRANFPALIALADEIVAALPATQRAPADLANAFEHHLRYSGDFSYTTDLTATRNNAIDPVEQFIRSDRRGHCQYFASALALMLRSQGVPARVVSGFKTSEFNQFGGYYTARQLHAHAWVEAYIVEEALPKTAELAGQLPTGGAWLRLDPTPARTAAMKSNVDSALDLAQVLWDDYVVELNSSRQPLGLFQSLTESESSPYDRFTKRLENFVLKLRSGRLGGGELAVDQLFSWRAAMLAFTGLILASALYHALPRFTLRPRQKPGVKGERRPDWATVEFYQRLKEILATRGFVRPKQRTPHAWLQEVGADLSTTNDSSDTNADIQQKIGLLARLFYHRRFGGLEQLDEGQRASVEASLDEVQRAVAPR